MPTVQDIIGYVEQQTGHPLNVDEAVTFGPRNAELTGVTVAWTINAETVAAAAAAGHNCIVHHESLTYPYPGFTSNGERHYLSWPTNTRRLSLLAKHDLTAIRIHGSVDEISIFDAFAEQLGLGAPIADSIAGTGADNICGDYTHKVYASPTATFGQLVEHVKKAIGMEALRTTAEDPQRPVKCIGLPWGGLGLFVNVRYLQVLIDMGADTLICGETDNYGFRFAAEAGIAVIETSHELSEARGLEIFADRLRSHLGIDVRFADLPCIWKMS